MTPDDGGLPASHLDWREGLPLLLTPSVVLRELRRSDAAALWRVSRTPAIARHAWPGPPTVEAYETSVTRAWRDRAAGKYAGFAVVPRDQMQPAGMFELRSLQPKFFRAELAFLIDPELWGSGVFRDGLRLVVDFAFKTVGARRIEMRSGVGNARCNAALEAMGVQQEAVLRSSFVYEGRFEDQYLWSLVSGLDRLR